MAGTRQPDGDAHRAALLKFITDFQHDRHFMPSIKEMSEATGLARTAIVWHLEKLRESKKVDYDDGNLARSLRLT
jgi:hypothetical protein